jgi:hypothetical protein
VVATAAEGAHSREKTLPVKRRAAPKLASISAVAILGWLTLSGSGHADTLNFDFSITNIAADGVNGTVTGLIEG